MIHNMQTLAAEIGEMHAIAGKKCTDRRIDFYLKKLGPYVGPELEAVIESFKECGECPGVRKILDGVHSRKRRTADNLLMPALTEEEKRRSDHAAIMSMLWLHYEHRWSIDRLVSDILTRVFARQVDDPKQAIEEAKKHYTKERVAEWMARKFVQIDAEDAKSETTSV